MATHFRVERNGRSGSTILSRKLPSCSDEASAMLGVPADQPSGRAASSTATSQPRCTTAASGRTATTRLDNMARRQGAGLLLVPLHLNGRMADPELLTEHGRRVM